jgi:hypothetical protein
MLSGPVVSRTFRLVLCVCAVVAAGVGVAAVLSGRGVPAADVVPEAETWVVDAGFVPPDEWMSPAWSGFFGFEDWWDGDFSRLNVEASDVDDPDAVRRVAVEALTASLRGERSGDVSEGVRTWLNAPLPFPWQSLAGRCDRVNVLGAHPALVPIPQRFKVNVAKTVIVWTGDCVDGLPDAVLGDAEVELTESSVKVSYVYAALGSSGWVPARATQLPGSASGVFPTGAAVPDEQLSEFSECSDVAVVVHVDLFAAMSQMCADAAAAGVALRFEAGLLSAEDLRDAYIAARRKFGPREAAVRVGWSLAGRCASPHCVGRAVDVSGAVAWLNAPVGCTAGGVLSEQGCSVGAVVRRVQLYGFVTPLPWDPGHLEWGLAPSMPGWAASCDPLPGLPVQSVIATLWRCRLGEAGFSAEQVREIVARAVLVAGCESGWNVRWQNGTDTAATPEGGLFSLTGGAADAFVPGGSGAVLDPSANADGAARLFIHLESSSGDGFSYWQGCVPAAMPPDAYQW